MRQPAPDGSLLTWEAIEPEFRWSALLLGNGLSANVWKGFGYASLYKEARRVGSLVAADRELFEALQTQNFERVLGDVSRSITVLGALGKKTDFLLERYVSIQEALGDAVRAVHVPWLDVPAHTLATIQSELQRFAWVFTTSYDLLIYWAMGHEDNYGTLVDLFWGPKWSFNPSDTDIRAGSTPVYFLHGAMHLIVEGSGRTRKLRRTMAATLLDQFGEPIEEDPQARPLLVTEGSSRDKVQAIEGNDYLAHALATLQAPHLNVPLVVFGSSFGEQDRHLADALSVNPDRPVAVSMTPGGKRDLRAKQGDLFGRIEAQPLLFFDATTHPLGADDLAPLEA
jgi:hypothetical protein